MAILASKTGSGSWIRTNGLRVMSPTSFHCSIPRRIAFSAPYIPQSWGTLEIWGTPPDPRQEESCTSFLEGSKAFLNPLNPSVLGDFRNLGDTPKPPSGGILHLFKIWEHPQTPSVLRWKDTFSQPPESLSQGRIGALGLGGHTLP